MNIWNEQKRKQKELLSELTTDFYLSQGKTVIKITPNSMVSMKRKKHLTVMGKYEPKVERGTFLIDSVMDEWEHD